MRDNLPIIEKYRSLFYRNREPGIVDLDQSDVYHTAFTATRLEFITEHLKGKYPLNRQTPHLIAFVQKGGGNEIIGQHTFPIVDNMLFIVPSRMVHSSEFIGDFFKGFIICFDLELFINKSFSRGLVENRSILSGAFKPYTILNDQQAIQMELIMEQLIIEFEDRTKQIRSNEMICVKILELLILCERFFDNDADCGNSTSFPPRVVAFNELLENNFHLLHSVNSYASKLNLHPNTLNIFIKHHCGISAKAMINNKLVSESKYLLAHSKLTIKEIAARLGFEDPNYFSNFFKRQTGDTALTYRSIYAAAR